MKIYKSASRLLREGFGFLRELDFDEPREEYSESKLLGSGIALIYKSRSAVRGVRVNFSNDLRDAGFSIFIEGEDGESFSLNTWMRVKKHEDTELFELGSAEDETAGIVRFCTQVRPILEGPLRKTLLGQEWDSVPFDWAGYR